jgi:hypothetical protein
MQMQMSSRDLAPLELEYLPLPLLLPPATTNPLVQSEAALVSATTDSTPLWVFVYFSENLEECTKLFREQEKCEQFAVEYLARVGSYHFRPTGNLAHDLTVLRNIWLTTDQTDYWHVKECSIIE